MAQTRDPLKRQRPQHSQEGQGEAEKRLVVKFRTQDTRDILAELDLYGDRTLHVISDLEELFSDYVNWVVRGRFDPSVPQQRLAFTKVQKEATNLAAFLENLDDSTAMLLQMSDVSSQIEGVPSPERLKAIAWELRRIADAAQRQLGKERFRKPGPKPVFDRAWIEEQLTKRFLAWSNKSASFAKRPVLNPDGSEARRTEAASPATRFIDAAMKALNLGCLYDAERGICTPVTAYVKQQGGDVRLLQPDAAINEMEAKRLRKRRGRLRESGSSKS